MSLQQAQRSPHYPAVQQTRIALSRWDGLRIDQRLHRHRVHCLAERGLNNTEIADVTRLPLGAVKEHRYGSPGPARPPLPNPEVSTQREVELETTAHLATHLAFLLRTEDPNLVWGALSRLDRRQLQELAVIALAAIPIDETTRQLYAWVEDLP